MPSKRKWDVVVLGGINTDFLACANRLPAAGETIQGSRFMIAPGGKGANQAVAAARLGARVAFIGCVGCDARCEELVTSLKREGVDVSHVKRVRRAVSGAALIMVDASGEKQILAAPGATLKLTKSDVRAARRLIESTKVFLTQFEVPMPVVLEAVSLAHHSGARVVLDPAPAARAPRSLFKHVDVVRPNSSEAEALTGIRVEDQRTARSAARKLIAFGVSAAAIQAGSDGDLLVWDSGEELLPRLRVKTVDATGAGDAFAAGLAVALSEGKPWDECGRLANAAAALATTRYGAQPAMPWRADVNRLLSRRGSPGNRRHPG